MLMVEKMCVEEQERKERQKIKNHEPHEMMHLIVSINSQDLCKVL